MVCLGWVIDMIRILLCRVMSNPISLFRHHNLCDSDGCCYRNCSASAGSFQHFINLLMCQKAKDENLR